MDKTILRNIKDELHEQADIQFCREFLRLTNLKEGDKVEAKFTSYYLLNLGQDYRSTQEVKKGVIRKCPENDMLYVESIEDLTFVEHMTNNRSGRNFRSWYEKRERKAKTDLLNIVLKDDLTEVTK